jgi:hypothetical protein
MADREAVRTLALSQPEAVEADHHGIPSFHVGGKIFCTIHLDQPRAMLKFNGEDQSNLLEDGVIEPVPGYWGRKGSTFVWYERLEVDRLATLMRLAWASVAPKRLLPKAGPAA